MDNAELYIQKYKELETAVRETYDIPAGDSIAYFLGNQERFRTHKAEISYCSQVRNLLQHKEKINGGYPIQPSKEMLDYIDGLIDAVRNRTKCFSLMTPLAKLLYAGMDDKVKQFLSEMKERDISCLPILDDKHVVGVFSETSLFGWLADHEGICVSDELTFRDMEDYISLEGFEKGRYFFVPMDIHADELSLRINLYQRRNKRVKACFLTHSGHAEERILGMIVPGDLVGR